MSGALAFRQLRPTAATTPLRRGAAIPSAPFSSTRQPTRPATPAAPAAAPSHLLRPSRSAPSLYQSRHQSTAKRLTQRLRVPPAQAYAAAPAPGAADHVVFNPPSAAPSVHHTPLKFLPRQDRRRRELLAAAAAAGATEPGRAAAAVEQPSTPLAAARGQGAGGVAGGAEGTASRTPAPAPLLPPTLRREDPNYRRKYHLTRAQVDEMRRLRLEDGHEWTRGALARRFGCSETFVGIVVRNPERGEAHRKMLEDAYRRWGRKKREAKEDRLRRRETWVRDL